jgi:hypothetical protein
MFKLPHRVDYITTLPFEINKIMAEDDIASFREKEITFE